MNTRDLSADDIIGVDACDDTNFCFFFTYAGHDVMSRKSFDIRN